MLKVLLVDDEPFIIQGLKVLIDWEQEGYMIAGTASVSYTHLTLPTNSLV